MRWRPSTPSSRSAMERSSVRWSASWLKVVEEGGSNFTCWRRPFAESAANTSASCPREVAASPQTTIDASSAEWRCTLRLQDGRGDGTGPGRETTYGRATWLIGPCAERQYE